MKSFRIQVIEKKNNIKDGKSKQVIETERICTVKEKTRGNRSLFGKSHRHK